MVLQQSPLEEDGTRDRSLERAYAKMEGEASTLVERFITAARNGTELVLTEDEKGIWVYFFYQQIKRVPEMFRQLEVQRTFADRIGDAIKKLELRIGRPLTEEESRDLRAPESLARIQQNATLKALADPGQLIQTLLLTMALELAVAPPGSAFVIGSQPVARTANGASTNMLDPTVQLWLPIASDVAVRFVLASSPLAVTNISEDYVARINWQIYKQSEMIAAASDDIITGVVNS